MNTCKATVRVLVAHRTYIIIYLVLMGIMMFTLSWSQITAATRTVADTYEPEKVNVAVIDRDANRGGIAEELRDYLSDSATLVELDDDAESLQQAVASNWTDLIVIIPRGYAADFLKAAQSGSDMPKVETVTSYTSGAGTIGGMNVNGFLSLTRIALIGGNVKIDDSALAAQYAQYANSFAAAGQNDDWSQAVGGSSTFDLNSLPEGTLSDLTTSDVQSAAKRAARTAHDAKVNRPVVVENITTRDDREASTANSGASGFGDTMKTAIYPLFLTLSVCVSLVARVFGAGELRRRLMASPSTASIGLKRMGVLCGFALLICVGYLAVALGLIAAAGVDITSIPVSGVMMTFVSICMFSLMCTACGFMLGEFGASDMVANGFANVFGLLILFTSGIAFPMSMMPDMMVTVARLTPGWWYCTAIDNALGFGSAASGVDAGGWAVATGIVMLFSLAFVCVGLAAGKYRRSRPNAVASTVTQLAEA
ncbi:ABC transporter permease [Bifidobacterium imperatoris]|uniref:ABC transporter permease n=1 Tax=Bifidobacterium imperatoris TaxID=2020965 RepID=A0A2N5IQC3_9BIFI|nr:ABC transporter permease [Bifidobacterium imperatoris]PLS24162.1 multidrug permease ABC transporter [Bifidobacterium imperatoris]QSY57342.1 ABC transporter permease [Bifidobacterium imperatoris]